MTSSSTGALRRCVRRIDRASQRVRLTSLRSASSLPLDVDERAQQLDVRREPAAAFQRQIELGEPDRRARELLVRERLGLAVDLLAVERVHLQRDGRLARGNALVREPLELAHARRGGR